MPALPSPRPRRRGLLGLVLILALPLGCTEPTAVPTTPAVDFMVDGQRFVPDRAAISLLLGEQPPTLIIDAEAQRGAFVTFVRVLIRDFSGRGTYRLAGLTPPHSRVGFVARFTAGDTLPVTFVTGAPSTGELIVDEYDPLARTMRARFDFVAQDVAGSARVTVTGGTASGRYGTGPLF